MTISVLVNRAKMTVLVAPTTGTIPLNAASVGYSTFAAAGVPNAAAVSYVIEDGAAWELGQGTFYSATSAVTMTIASPAVVSWTTHGLVVGTPVVFTTTGALPTGLTVGTVYYIIAGGFTTGAFQVSLTAGGTAVNTSGSQSGTHTCTADALFRTSIAASSNANAAIVAGAFAQVYLTALASDLTPPVIANGSVATAMTSVGPTGSNTTVQEWFQIKGTSGAIRYVPGF